MFLFCPDLNDRLFRAGLLAQPEIFRCPVPFCVPPLEVPFVLSVAVIKIALAVKSLLDFLKPGGKFLAVPHLSCRESLVAVPQEIFLRKLWIDVFRILDLEIPVVVLRVVNTVFPGAPVVSREFHSKFSPSRFFFFSKPAFPQNCRVIKNEISLFGDGR